MQTTYAIAGGVLYVPTQEQVCKTKSIKIHSQLTLRKLKLQLQNIWKSIYSKLINSLKPQTEHEMYVQQLINQKESHRYRNVLCICPYHPCKEKKNDLCDW